jgi:hypothetical protein
MTRETVALGWSDQQALNEVEEVDFICNDCNRIFRDSVCMERDQDGEFSLSPPLCPNCTAECVRVELWGTAESEGRVEDMREARQNYLHTRIETSVVRRQQYPEFRDEIGYDANRPRIYQTMWRARPARKGIRYSWIVWPLSGAHLDLRTEHPRSLFRSPSVVEQYCRGCLTEGEDWHNVRLLTFNSINTVTQERLWQKEFLTVTLKTEFLDHDDLTKMGRHIQQMEGQRRILVQLGVFGWNALMTALEQDPERIVEVKELIGFSIYDEQAVIDHGRCPAADNVDQLGLQWTIWPEGDVFDSQELFEIEKVSKMEILRKRVDVPVRIHCRVRGKVCLKSK